MKLFGTTTSPFVRRVRIVAAEIGEPIELVNTATEAGQAALRELSPIAKVPIAQVDGKTLFDSRVINSWLVGSRGWGGLAPASDPWEEQNVINAIDGALESMISVFYLKRDGMAIADLPLTKRQTERVAAILTWLAPYFASESAKDALTLQRIALISAIDWLDFRDMYPTAKHPWLAGFRQQMDTKASVQATKPVVT